MIYIYMTLFSICFVYLSSVVEKSTDLENISTKMVENVTFLIAFLIICVPGMIRYNVGIDYRTYSLGQIPDVLANEQVNLELLFKLLIKFGYWLTGGTSYQVIFALMNFIIDFFIFKYIKVQSKNLPLSLLIFMFGGFFAFSLSGMRQSIGVSIALYSIKYIYQKKPIRFVILILLASLFHTSALIFVLFYIPRFKIEVQHLIKQTNLQKKAMKTYSC